MPRIDPLQLLKCLSVLLTPEGGILSRDEVPRLVNLMTKFSKKLVSKCVYLLILKNTDTDLVDMFMAEGGWTLIQTWLQDAVQTSNWDLVREILGLLLMTPTDVERLKLNILPKLIKSLSRRDELEGVAELSARLVQQWLKIVKGSSSQAQVQPAPIVKSEPLKNTPTEDKPRVNEQQTIEYVEETSAAINTDTFYKTSGKYGKTLVHKPKDGESEEGAEVDQVSDEAENKKEDKKDKEKDRSKSSKSSSSSSNKEKSRDKDDKKKSSSSSRGNSSKSRSSSRSKDEERKDRDKDKDRDRYRKNGEIRSGSRDKKDYKDKERDKDKKHRSEKDKGKQDDKDKDKQAEKDKDTLDKLIPPSISKLGRIPKKSSSSTSPVENKASQDQEDTLEVKKKSFSVGIRKDREERPKTVKIFNSKMRSTGLEEEVKPAPPRNPTKKPTPSVQLPTIPQKRPSPPRETSEPIVPPEKKIKIDKIDTPERPGAIKLIPPKPKPALLLESDLFNEALTAATTKKEPKKRKRRLSMSKDNKDTSSPTSEPPPTPTSPNPSNQVNTSSGSENYCPINFYQDTLSEATKEGKNEDEDKENSIENAEESLNNSVNESMVEGKETPSPPRTPTDDSKEDETLEVKKPKLDGGLKGVLLYTKKKGPKKSISWKNDTDLVDIRYFELDETERVNVTKTFGDMAKMDISSEREALQQSRKVGGEDSMETQITWRVPFMLNVEEPLALPGCKSLEKDIQFAREKSVLQAFYFDKRKIPDSPEEPILENHQMSDPAHIPLEDPEGQEIDLRTTVWPEPKGLPPQPEPQPVQPVFPNIQAPFQAPFNNMPPPAAFQPVPPQFNGPIGPMGPVGVVPGNFVPPNMLPNGPMMGQPNMGPVPHEMMNMNPNMYPPGPMPDGFGPGPMPPDGYGPGPMPPDGFGPGPDFPMFPNQNQPNNMNNFKPHNKFNNHRPHNRGGGGFRRGGRDGWVNVNRNNSNWKRGGGHRGGRLCKNVQNRGFCRNRDNCPFVHP